jgi:hypothetical protein
LLASFLFWIDPTAYRMLSRLAMASYRRHRIALVDDQAGAFSQEIAPVSAQPGQKEVVRVAREKAHTAPLPDETAILKTAVNPSVAACSSDGYQSDR